MSRNLIVASLSTLVLLTGCVSKSQYQELEGKLATCEQEKAKADAAVISWEQRFDREAKRWNEMEKSVTDALPRALTEFQEERQRIVQMVPDQVRGEVEKYLQDYTAAVMKGFEKLKEDNQEIKIQLLATQKALDMVSSDTKTIGADTKSIGKMIDTSLSGERSKREQLSKELADVINRIVEFDQTKINCKNCPERLKMRDKTKEEMLAFHQELMQDLSSIQTAASIPASASEPSDAAEDAGSER